LASSADAFRGIYKNRPKDGEYTFPMIHVYGFSKARDPEFDFHEVGRWYGVYLCRVFDWTSLITFIFYFVVGVIVVCWTLF